MPPNMKTKAIGCVLSACMAIAALADDVELSNGQKLTGVSVSRAEPDGLVLVTDDGIQKVPFEQLAKSVRERYGYSEKAAADFSAAVHAAAIERGTQAREYAVARQAEAARAAAATPAPKPEELGKLARVRGVVAQVVPGGLIVCAEEPRAITNYAGSIGRGENVGFAQDTAAAGRPTAVYGVFLIAGHAKQGALVDGDAVDVDAREAGVFKFTGSDGALHTVKRYRVSRIVK